MSNHAKIDVTRDEGLALIRARQLALLDGGDDPDSYIWSRRVEEPLQEFSRFNIGDMVCHTDDVDDRSACEVAAMHVFTYPTAAGTQHGIWLTLEPVYDRLEDAIEVAETDDLVNATTKPQHKRSAA